MISIGPRVKFLGGIAAGMSAVLRNAHREAAILLQANYGRTLQDWLFAANRAMCVVPGEEPAT